MPDRVDPNLKKSLHRHLETHMPFYLDLLRQMVEINSFTANPKGVNKLGQLTAETFAGLGFTAEAVQALNLLYGKHHILIRPGRSQYKIGLVSHLDTVFPPDEELNNQFFWRPEGDRIYGPGTQDIKGGTVMIYMMLAALKEIIPQIFDKITWVVLFNAAEEVAAPDFGDICLQHLDSNTLAALVFEAGDVTEDQCLTVVYRKGMALFRIMVEGRAAHAGGAHHLGANAILQMAHTIQQISALTDYERDLTFNIGTVAGGTVINRVPHYATATGEMRAFDLEIFQEGLDRLLALTDQVSVRSIQDDFPCKIEIEVLHQTPPWPRNVPSDRLLTYWQEAGQALGLHVLPEKRGGLSDANLLWSHVPTIDGLGPAGRNAHCSEQSADGTKEQEYVIPSSFVPKALLNLMAILNLIEAETE